MQFKIQQIAICPKDPQRARALLERIGLSKWIEDTVVASGKVHGVSGRNTAALAFNYESFDGNELEVLQYTDGPNWMAGHQPTISHLGMHCSEAELSAWKALFESEGISIAQEVFTESHTNPYLLETGRRYHYCIFDTRAILGTDLKFIVRREKE